MNFWVFFFITTVHLLVFMFFMLAPFRKKLRFPPPILAGIIAVYMLLSLVMFRFGFNSEAVIPGFYPLAMLCWVALTLAGCFACIKTPPTQLLFSILIILDIQSLMLVFVKVIWRVFFLPRTGFPYGAQLLSVAVLLAVFAPFMWALFIGMFQKVVESDIDFTNWRLFILIPILHYIFDSVTGFGGIGHGGVFEFTDFVALALNIAVIFTTYLVSFRMLLKVNDGYLMEKRTILMEQQIEMQKSEYSRLTESIKKDAQQRHDWRHELYLLSSYAEAGNMAAIQEYLQRYIQGQTYESDIVYCAHPTVDMLLHHFVGQAKKHGILLNPCVQVPADLPISDSDLCIVFGNLLENAVEACSIQKSGPRTIDLQAGVRGQQFLVFIKNTFDSPVIKTAKEGVFRSTKHKGDGIGLPSVCSIVDRTDGICRVKTEGKQFCVNLLMNL